VKRQSSQNEDPEQIGVDPSEIDAVEPARTPHFTKGYWDRTLNHLNILDSPKVLKLLFHRKRVPRGIESSIHKAAARAGRRVSVYVRGAAVYICDRDKGESSRSQPTRADIKCEVCGLPISPKPGTSKQYVHAGTKHKKSKCQKVLRYAREHGISVDEAKQRRRYRQRLASRGSSDK